MLKAQAPKKAAKNPAKHTYEQTLEASTSYFKEKLPATVFTDKYAMRDSDNNLLELTPDDMHDRLAGEFARIDHEKYGLDHDTQYSLYRDALHQFARVVPQGSPMCAIGNTHQIMSASNCVVVESPHDSIAGIMKTGTELAQLYKRRCGVGLDLSTLRPDGFKVNNAAKSTSGAWSFADYYSYITRMIGQCLHKDTQILTQNGFKTIQHITIDDSVWTAKGWVRVQGVIENKKPCVKVTTYYGHEIICSEDHVFHTIHGEKAIKDLVVNSPITQIISEKGWVGQDVELAITPYSRNPYNKSNRLKEINLPSRLTPKFSYILGQMYGDGYVTECTQEIKELGVEVALSDDWPDIKIKLQTYVKEVFNIEMTFSTGDGACEVGGINSKVLTQFLKENGLLKQKAHQLVFPEQLLKADPINACAFISGFLDADGDIQVSKKGYRIRSTCKNILLHFQNILNALGVPCRIHREKRNDKLGQEKWKDLYYLTINGMKAQHKFYELMGESVKIRSNPPFNKKMDFLRTCYKTSDFNTRASKHSYIIDDRQWITFSTSDRLKTDTKTALDVRLLQDYILDIQPYEKGGEQAVYDLVLPDEHLFFANGLYAHNSGRRGALMLTLDVAHPDILKFVTMKTDLTKVTGANVSVRLSDIFLKAVDEDGEYEQYWPMEGPKQYSKMVKAREVWKTIIDTATRTAEPGLIYWDRMTKFLPAHSYKQFRSVSTNPCCFSQDSQVMVLTRKGLKEIKQITSTDEVWIDSANEWANTSGYFKAGYAPVYKVSFDNGEHFVITDNHKLSSCGQLIELRDLKVGAPIDCQVDPVTFSKKSTSIVSIVKVGNKPVGCIEVEKYHKFTANGIISGNSEICLSPYDSCRLVSLNLTGYVRNAFTNPTFDWQMFTSDVKLATQMCDNLVDLELELIDKIKVACDGEDEKILWSKLWQAGHDGRRTGLGTHGVADALAQLNIKYDSEEALEMVDKIYGALCHTTYETSTELAEIRGSFPAWEWAVDKDNDFIKSLPAALQEKIQQRGRRNIAMLTQAPTGSVSIISKCGEFDRWNVSSGVEPVFRNFYIRKKKINPNDKARVDVKDALGDTWQEYPVFHPNVKNYLEKVKGYKLGASDDSLDEAAISKLKSEKLPEFFVTSDQIDWKYRVKLQGNEQRYIDHSISATINLPKGTPSDVVGGIYLEGWRQGLKGITVYVDGSRSGVLVTESEKMVKVDPAVRPEKIVTMSAPKRPKTLPCDIHQVTVDGKKWAVMIGLLHNHPYEVFLGYSEQLQLPARYKAGSITKTGKGKYQLHVGEGDDELIIKDIISVFDNPQSAWATRLLSTSLRHGVSPEYLAQTLSKDGRMNDINRVIARVLKKYIPEGGKVTISTSCPLCKSTNLRYQEGCVFCVECGISPKGCS